MAGALEGVRVVEFANYVSGPYAGMLLGDLGAEVIKIESPMAATRSRLGPRRIRPDFRLGQPQQEERGARPQERARRCRRARAHPHRRRADREFRSARWSGSGSATTRLLAKIRDWCGARSPDSVRAVPMRRVLDTTPSARRLSGLLSLLTDLDRPRPMGISLSDHLAGIVACNGVLGALVARGRTGKGQRVDTSLLEATVSFCGENAARFFENRRAPNRATRARQAQVYAFVAGDGKPFVIHLSSPAKFWQALARVAGRPEWLDDPRFASKETRGRHYDALNDELAAVFKHDTRAAWLAKLQAEDVPAAALNDARRGVRGPAGRTSRHAAGRAAPAGRHDRTGTQRLADVGDPAGASARPRPNSASIPTRYWRSSTAPRHDALRMCIGAVTAACVALAGATHANAQSVAEFYRGKRIDLVTSASVGGGYDQYARLLAKHMPRHIPGEPAIIVQNMVGAEGLRAANFLYNIAPQDGTVIGGLSRNTGLARFYDFNNAGIQFDVRKFHWLGSPQQEVGLFILSTRSGLAAIGDLEQREVTISSTARNSPSSIYSRILNARNRHQTQADRRL